MKQAEATRLQPRDRLIVALDLPSVEAAQAMVSRLGDAVSFYKIGYQLAFAGGLSCAGSCRRRQARFSRSQAARHRQHGGTGRQERGAAWCEVSYRARLSADHAGCGRRARGACAFSPSPCSPPPTTRSEAAGYASSVRELVAGRAAQAREIGVDGIVCSAAEAAKLRAIIGPKMALVTPGIGRPAATAAIKTHHDPDCSHCRRRGLSGRRPADLGSGRPQGGGGGDRRRNCAAGERGEMTWPRATGSRASTC